MPTRQDPNYLTYYDGPLSIKYETDEDRDYFQRQFQGFNPGEYLLDASTGMPHLSNPLQRWRVAPGSWGEDYVFLEEKRNRWFEWGWRTVAERRLLFANPNYARWVAGLILYEIDLENAKTKKRESLYGTFPPDKMN